MFELFSKQKVVNMLVKLSFYTPVLFILYFFSIFVCVFMLYFVVSMFDSDFSCQP